MKVILKKKSLYTAEAVSNDGTTVYFSRTNSTWTDYGIGSKQIGDELEVEVQKSDKGRDFITRLTADKLVDVLRIENALLQGQILAKNAREGA